MTDCTDLHKLVTFNHFYSIWSSEFRNLSGFCEANLYWTEWKMFVHHKLIHSEILNMYFHVCIFLLRLKHKQVKDIWTVCLFDMIMYSRPVDRLIHVTNLFY